MSRLRAQDGFTLPELLTAISISTIVLLGAFGLLDVVLKRTGETRARVETAQVARETLETMTQQLRSEVCPTTATPAIAAASGNSVTFYTDLSDGTAALKDRVQKRVIAYDPVTRRLTQSIYLPTGVGSAATPPGPTFLATPSSVRRLAANVYPDPASQATSSGTQSIFRFFAYAPGTAATGTTAATAATPSLELTAPSTTTDLARIARIQIAFVVKSPSTAMGDRGAITLHDQVLVRSANPNDLAPVPKCA
jgi:prepilin-type N-terminal cleavage/methylation domain-containing protein